MALDEFKGAAADFVDAADSTLSEASSATQQLAGEVQVGERQTVQMRMPMDPAVHCI
jgi:hypothetical protein